MVELAWCRHLDRRVRYSRAVCCSSSKRPTFRARLWPACERTCNVCRTPSRGNTPFVSHTTNVPHHRQSPLQLSVCRSCRGTVGTRLLSNTLEQSIRTAFSFPWYSIWLGADHRLGPFWSHALLQPQQCIPSSVGRVGNNVKLDLRDGSRKRRQFHRFRNYAWSDAAPHGIIYRLVWERPSKSLHPTKKLAFFGG